MSYILVLAGRPVSKKNSWGIGGDNRSSWGSRIVQRNKGLKGYVESLRIQAAFQMRRVRAVQVARPAKVALRFRVFFAKKQGCMDVHNAIETVLDALQTVVYENDNQVLGTFHPPARFIDEKNPRVEVEVQDAEEAQGEARWQ